MDASFSVYILPFCITLKTHIKLSLLIQKLYSYIYQVDKTFQMVLSYHLFQITVNLRVLVEKFTPRIVYVKSGVDFYAQTDIKRCRLEIGIPDVSYSQFPSVFQRSKLLQNPPSC